jgi:putative transposase
MTDVAEDRDQAGAELSVADEQVLRELTERARAGGLKLTGEGGLLGRLTKMVIEGALEGELDDHLGYGKHDPEGRDGGNSRNGRRSRRCLLIRGRWRFRCRGTGIPVSSRKSSPKGSGG